LLVIATLAAAIVENPLRCEGSLPQAISPDWFRLYLLPAVLSELQQQAIAPVRERWAWAVLLEPCV